MNTDIGVAQDKRIDVRRNRMIFENADSGRRRVVRALGIAFVTAGAVILGLVCSSVAVSPELPKLPLALQSAGANLAIEKLDEGPASSFSAAKFSPNLCRSRGSATASARSIRPRAPAATAVVTKASSAPGPAKTFGAGFLNAAFVLQGEPLSVASMRSHIANLQVVFPDWMSFADASGAMSVNVDPKLADELRAAGVKVLPRLTNTDAGGNWFEDELGAFLRDKKSDAADVFLDRLVATLEQTKSDGVNIDIESLHPEDSGSYVEWLDRVTDALHARGLLVTVDVPMNDEAFDYEAIGRIADAVVLMAYDEHWSTSSPGPIASRPWFEEGLVQATKRIDPNKLIAGVGAYAYDWTEGVKTAESMGFDEALALARHRDAVIETGADDVNSHFEYFDNAEHEHQVWLLDAMSAWNQYLFARRAGIRGAALWRTGLEEPQFWSFFGSPNWAGFDPHSLSLTPAAATVRFEGRGELLRVREAAHDGSRDLDVANGFIDWGRYTSLPESFEVQRFGEGQPKKIALTFDDGPDPLWTPQILHVLEKWDVPATFFLIGENVQRFPQLARDEVASGRLIGNHTFTHSDLRAISRERLWAELTATQRQIEAATGRSTLLFRAPYDADSEPTSAAQLSPLEDIDEMGYLVAGADVDSEDYLRPGADRIFDNVMKGLAATGGRIVVFHDSGGDRSQTVAALERLIPALRAAGYEIAPLNALAGIAAAVLNPEISGREAFLSTGARILSWARTSGAEALAYVFAVTTAIAILRILFLGALATRRKRVAEIAAGPAFEPRVCVLIPAFNEARVIGRTIEAALASDYRRLRILVVDDGSTDDTASVVAAHAARDRRVSLLRQPNGGKSSALNHGAQAAQEGVIVTLDADTLVLRHTISSLVAPFADAKIDAVCGNVQVGNVRNLLTAFQSVEYVTSQNYDRRAFDSLNCISVVPGATGAWRRETLLSVGGYSADTLTEDADLTLTILAAGGRITYAPLAQSVTEAPETVKALFRQRFRWSFGTLQCLWKHRRHFGRGALGRVALPNVALFQLLFPLLAPLGDFILLLAILRLDFQPVAVGYATFLALDLLASVVAFRLDRRPVGGLWVVAVQRFVYRPFLYVVTFVVVVAALRGKRQLWNKLKRTGAVELAEIPVEAETARAA